MDTLDTLFPNPLDCYFALFQDAIFEHDPNITYVFENGDFKRRDRTLVLRKIVRMAQILFNTMKAEHTPLAQCKPSCDPSSLLGVVSRYSRDIYGFRRIKAKLVELRETEGITEYHQEKIERLVKESGDYGFLVSSDSPYIHRQAAILLYWFSVLKPFSLKPPKSQLNSLDANILAFFNEYFAYFLINIALRVQSSTLTIHESHVFFWDEFLNQLHFRSLSRSSLEFFLPNWVQS
jgi:hypothetical protein